MIRTLLVLAAAFAGALVLVAFNFGASNEQRADFVFINGTEPQTIDPGLLTGAPGVLEDASDPHSLISYIDRAQLDKLRDDGKLADGMLPKAAAIDAALAKGVQRVHVISYNFPDSLLLEVFTNEGTGTLVVNDIAALTPAEQAGGGS